MQDPGNMNTLANISPDLPRINDADKSAIKKYAEILAEYNTKINLVSRQMNAEELSQLLSESVLLNQYISPKIPDTVDAGSGNGILGIPVAILNKNKQVILVETKTKKAVFLQEVKKQLDLPNVEIVNASIEEYLKKSGKSGKTVISRGFPELSVFSNFIQKGLVTQAALITSENKIKKNEKCLVSVEKKIYNIPLRNFLKILIMEKTTREEKRM
jgi:16S rRNA (guanine527-N7)-methyltransferase